MKLVLALKANAIPRKSRTRPTRVLCKIKVPQGSTLGPLTLNLTWCMCTRPDLGLLLVEGVGAQHLGHGFEGHRQRQHELLKLLLVLTCINTCTPNCCSVSPERRCVESSALVGQTQTQICHESNLAASWRPSTPFLPLQICQKMRDTALTQIDHEEAPQRGVEGGAAPHVAQVGLVVDAQEGEVLALLTKHKAKSRGGGGTVEGGDGDQILTV